MNEISTARQQVDKLLRMYQQYKILAGRQAVLARQLAKAKLKRTAFDVIDNEYRTASDDLKRLSDSMTFASPTIWMMYKFEAYAHEAQPIRTMHDFRVHCSKPDYICTKRFVFVNQALERKNLTRLTDASKYPDELLLDKVYEAVKPLETDKEFMHDWEAYEYHSRDGRVAKWESFIYSV